MMAMKLLSARRFCGSASSGRNRRRSVKRFSSSSGSSGNLQMVLCTKCGASIAPDENFCGSCGAEMPHENTPSPSPASAGDAKPAKASTEASPMPGDSTWQEKQDESGEGSRSFGATSRAGASDERRPKPKALVAGKVLNHRYEI